MIRNQKKLLFQSLTMTGREAVREEHFRDNVCCDTAAIVTTIMSVIFGCDDF